ELVSDDRRRLERLHLHDAPLPLPLLRREIHRPPYRRPPCCHVAPMALRNYDPRFAPHQNHPSASPLRWMKERSSREPSNVEPHQNYPSASPLRSMKERSLREPLSVEPHQCCLNA